MSEARITPGPWVIHHDGPSLPIITAESEVRSEDVAHVLTNEVDARAIAEVPNMVEVLRDMVTYADEFDDMNVQPVRAARAILARIDEAKP